MKSFPNNQVGAPNESLEESGSFHSSKLPLSMVQLPIPGSLNDELMVRSVLTDSIKRSGKSRETIADEMSLLLGMSVTARMLTAFTAESKELHRWPGAWDRAFCYVVGDQRLLICRVQAAGLRVISASEQRLLEVGRQYLRREKAKKSLEAIEQEFDGVEL